MFNTMTESDGKNFVDIFIFYLRSWSQSMLFISLSIIFLSVLQDEVSSYTSSI